jgi:2-polyprenyl-3-methyl-5-hydroxy-6-metoxy-1,4-benzoquinol methylase
MNQSALSSLILQITELNPMQQGFLAKSEMLMTPPEVQLLEKYVQYFVSCGVSLQQLAEGYHLLVEDTLKELIHFRKNGRYRFSKVEELASAVYHDNDYMTKYMHGLLLTQFFWPNNMEIMRYFVQQLPKAKTGSYLEIGPGHGFFMMHAMTSTKFDWFVGVDLSEASINQTRALLDSGHFGKYSNYELAHLDFQQYQSEKKFMAVVMGEVLEHVENPRDFLTKIHSLTSPESFIYISTCINSPAIDHIYLFRNRDEVVDLCASANLKVRSDKMVPYGDLTIEDCQKRRLPINIGLVLQHA